MPESSDRSVVLLLGYSTTRRVKMTVRRAVVIAVAVAIKKKVVNELIVAVKRVAMLAVCL